MISMRNINKRTRMDGAWFLQILAILGSALSMVAIGILLTHFNNQPIFDWNGVTLNAIVAVFSAMSKAMLAYALSECLGQAKWIWFSSQHRPLSDIDLIDSGSRGPLGSFQILTQPVARSFISMGAIMILLSVTMDPFVQLSVGTKDSLKFENNTKVHIAYAKRYSKELLVEYDLISAFPDADSGLKSALFEGLSQPDSLISQQTLHSCPSGNCTWDPFTSLAICSSCNSLTNQIEKIESATKYPGPQYSGNFTKPRTLYRLPKGLLIDEMTLMDATGTWNATMTVSYASLDTLIWAMTMMNFTKNENQTSNDNVSAIECGLWICLQTYKSAVNNGILTEIIKPASSKIDPDSWQLVNKSKELKITTLSEGELFTPQIAIAQNSSFNRFARRTDLRLGEGFNLSQAAAYCIANLLRQTFANSGAKPGFANAYVSRSGRSSDNSIYYQPAAMQSLYTSQDLEATFATLAKSMTNHIRQNSDNGTVINGKEGKYVIVFRIRGWFLILPVILIVGSAIFFALVVHYTHMSRIEFWGTNALPIIALGGKMGPIFDENDMRASVMKRTAKRQLVQYPTFQARPVTDRVDTLSRSENQDESFEMVSSSNTSVIQSPLADAESVISSIRTSVIQSSLADVEGPVSPIRTSVIPNSPAEVVSIASPTRTSVTQGPSTDAVSITSNDA